MEEPPYTDADLEPGVLAETTLACLRGLRPLASPQGRLVAAVTLTLREEWALRHLTTLTRLLLGAPLRPALLRVVTANPLLAEELERRVAPAGADLVRSVRGSCLALWDEGTVVDAGECLASSGSVQGLSLLPSPCGGGVWDALSFVEAPFLASTPQVAGAARALAASLSQQLERGTWSGIVRHHVLVDAGSQRRLFSGGDAGVRTAASWAQLCELLSVPAAADYGLGVLCSAWVQAL